jgi:hypothetical protein
MKPPGPFLSVVPDPGGEDRELEAFLSAARQLAEPDAQQRARVAGALKAALPAAAPLAGFGAGAGGSGAAPRLASVGRAARPHGLWLALGAAVIGGLGFGLGSSVGRSAPVPPPSAAAPGASPSSMPSMPSMPSMLATTPSDARVDSVTALAAQPAGTGAATPSQSPRVAGAAESEPSARATKSAQRAAVRRRMGTSPADLAASAGDAAPQTLEFREALEHLRRARQQLEQGHATASLLLLSELDRRAGDLLFEERSATRVLALCAAGETPAARATAEQLEQRSPRSIYLRRLASSCVGQSAAPASDVSALHEGERPADETPTR